MQHRAWIVTLLVVEALLWVVVADFPYSGNLTHISPHLLALTLAGIQISLLFALNVAALVIAALIGALSRSWQSAIALNIIASLLAFVYLLMVAHIEPLFLLIEGAIAPLAALGWFGWLLRFVRAEFTA